MKNSGVGPRPQDQAINNIEFNEIKPLQKPKGPKVFNLVEHFENLNIREQKKEQSVKRNKIIMSAATVAGAVIGAAAVAIPSAFAGFVAGKALMGPALLGVKLNIIPPFALTIINPVGVAAASGFAGGITGGIAGALLCFSISKGLIQIIEERSFQYRIRSIENKCHEFFKDKDMGVNSGELICPLTGKLVVDPAQITTYEMVNGVKTPTLHPQYFEAAELYKHRDDKKIPLEILGLSPQVECEYVSSYEGRNRILNLYLEFCIRNSEGKKFKDEKGSSALDGKEQEMMVEFIRSYYHILALQKSEIDQNIKVNKDEISKNYLKKQVWDEQKRVELEECTNHYHKIHKKTFRNMTTFEACFKITNIPELMESSPKGYDSLNPRHVNNLNPRDLNHRANETKYE